MTVNDTGSSPGARFSFSPTMRWSLSNSISVIPGALVLSTVKVIGPAGTLVISSAQPSFPPLLAIVTLTVLPRPGRADVSARVAARSNPNPATATRAVVVNPIS